MSPERWSDRGVLAGLYALAGAGLLLFAVVRRRRRSRRESVADDWRIEADKASIKDLDAATLTLRLGIAVNALRAAQRFYLATKDAPGPGGERDRFWAFLVAAGYLHEAIDLLRPQFPRVRDLARAGGAPEELIAEVGALMSGRVPFSRAIREMRNTLIFHWDDAPVRKYAQEYAGDSVVWADGVGDSEGESIYRAAADAVSNSVLPDDFALPDTPEASIRRIGELMRDVALTTGKLTKLFHHAIAGHLIGHGAKQKRTRRT